MAIIRQDLISDDFLTYVTGNQLIGTIDASDTDVILVAIICHGGASTLNPTILDEDGDTWTEEHEAYSNPNCTIFTSKNPTSNAAKDVSFSFPSPASDIIVAVIAYTGLDLTTPIAEFVDDSPMGSGNTGFDVNIITGAVALFINYIDASWAGSHSFGTGQTAIVDITNGSSYRGVITEEFLTGSGTDTQSNSNWFTGALLAGIVLQEPTGGGGGSTEIGDRFVRRHNAARGSTSNTTAADIGYDTAVLSEGGYSWSSPEATVDTAGKYLCLFDIGEVQLAGSTRAVGTLVPAINGTQQTLYKARHRYLRNSGGIHNVSFGSCILDLAVNDDVKVRNPGAITGTDALGNYGTNVNQGGGFQLIYLGNNNFTEVQRTTGQSPIAITYANATRPWLDSTPTWTLLTFTSEVNDDDSLYPGTGGVITLKANKKYLISYGATFDGSSNQRHTHHLALNIDGTRVQHETGYERNNASDGPPMQGMYLHETGGSTETLEIYGAVEQEDNAVGNTVTCDNAYVQVYEFPDSAEWIHVDNGTADSLTTALAGTTTYYDTPLSATFRADGDSNLSLDGANNAVQNDSGAVLPVLAIGWHMWDRDSGVSGTRKHAWTYWDNNGTRLAYGISGGYNRGQQGNDDTHRLGYVAAATMDLAIGADLSFVVRDPQSGANSDMGIYASTSRYFLGVQVLNLDSLNPPPGGSMSASIDTDSTISIAQISAHGSLSATETTDSTISADLTASGKLSATKNTGSTISVADLSGEAKMSSAVSTNSSISANLKALASLQSSINTSSSISADISASGSLSATVNTDSTISVANLTFVAGSMSSTISTQSTIFTASLSGDGSLQANINTDSTISASLKSLASISSSINTNSTISTALLTKVSEISSTVSSQSTISASLSASGSLSATINTVSTLSATLKKISEITASINTSSTISASLSSENKMSATISTDSTIFTADLSAEVSMQGAINTNSSISANISSIFSKLIGSADTESTISADLSAFGSLSSAISTNSTIPSAILSGEGSMSSTVSAGTTIAVATLSSGLTMSATVNTVSTISAGIKATVCISATINSSSSISAAFKIIVSEIIYLNSTIFTEVSGSSSVVLAIEMNSIVEEDSQENDGIQDTIVVYSLPTTQIELNSTVI